MACLGSSLDLPPPPQPPPRLGAEAHASRIAAGSAATEAALLAAARTDAQLWPQRAKGPAITEPRPLPSQPTLLSAQEAAKIAAAQARLVADMVQHSTDRRQQAAACNESARRLDHRHANLKREAAEVDRRRARAEDIDRLLHGIESRGTKHRGSSAREGCGQEGVQPSRDSEHRRRRGMLPRACDTLCVALCFAQWCEHWVRSRLDRVLAGASGLAELSGRLQHEAKRVVENEQSEQAELRAQLEEHSKVRSASLELERSLNEERSRRRQAEAVVDRKADEQLQERRRRWRVSSSLLSVAEQGVMRPVMAMCFMTWKEARQKSLLEAAQEHSRALASAAATFKASVLETLEEERRHRSLLENQLTNEQARCRSIHKSWQHSDQEVTEMLATLWQDWQATDSDLQKLADLAFDADRAKQNAEDMAGSRRETMKMTE